jgi:uncharacterized protein with PIN domain
MMSDRKTIRGLVKGGDIMITGEEMQRLYLDGKPIRRYCLQCRGPKLMISPKEKTPSHTPYTNEVPSKYRIVCRTCGMKYWAKVEAGSD